MADDQTEWVINFEGDDKVTIGGKTLTGADVAAFFQANTARHQCPVCEHTTWMILLAPPGDGGYLAIPTAKQSADGTVTLNRPTIPIALLICDRCGFIIQHALKSIFHWSARRGE